MIKRAEHPWPISKQKREKLTNSLLTKISVPSLHGVSHHGLGGNISPPRQFEQNRPVTM
jgi:hypothetical protein